MCVGPFRQKSSPAPPAPVLPPPPPPQAPAPVTPPPDDVISEVNPQVRRAKSKKAKSGLAKGTGSLRIPLKNTPNTGTDSPAGGLNV